MIGLLFVIFGFFFLILGYAHIPALAVAGVVMMMIGGASGIYSLTSDR